MTFISFNVWSYWRRWVSAEVKLLSRLWVLSTWTKKERKRQTLIKVSSSCSGQRGVPEMTGAEPWKQLYVQAHGSHVTYVRFIMWLKVRHKDDFRSTAVTAGMLMSHFYCFLFGWWSCEMCFSFVNVWKSRKSNTDTLRCRTRPHQSQMTQSSGP